MSLAKIVSLHGPPSPSSWDEHLTSGQSHHFGPESTFVRGSAGVAEDSGPRCGISVGSAGHPHFCGAPCRSLRRGRCFDSAACGFCHYCPEGLPRKLDNLNKELLEEMGAYAREALLAALVREKLGDLQAGPGAARAVQAWKHAMGDGLLAPVIQSPLFANIAHWRMRKLVGILRRVNFRIICRITCTYCEGSALAQATEALFAWLRKQERERIGVVSL